MASIKPAKMLSSERFENSLTRNVMPTISFREATNRFEFYKIVVQSKFLKDKHNYKDAAPFTTREDFFTQIFKKESII